MVESMIGLLRQNQSFNQATRCYEGLLSDSKIPVFSSSSFPVSTSRYHSLAILFSSGLLGWGANFIRIFIGYYWLQRKPKPHLNVKHHRAGNFCSAVVESN